VAAHGAYPEGISDRDTRLRPAQQLVPGEHGERRPFLDRVPDERLVAEGQQGAAADVGDDGGTERGELRHAHGLGEAPDLEVARVDPEDGAGVLAMAAS
jgi:hypothetical protein